jgi:small GTP-binding protein
MTEQKMQNIKIALIGDCGVGKTSISVRYTRNEFKNEYVSTSGASYSIKKVEKFGETLQLDIWDTAGQERYRSLGRNFYKDAFIVILVYDITRQETFENLKSVWYKELEENGEEKPILAIVGNKSDQYELDNTVNEDEARTYTDKIGGIFKLVSAKNGSGIDDLFNQLLEAYFEKNFPEKVIKNLQRRKSSKLKQDDDDSNDSGTGQKIEILLIY